jgi:hypothetical protein
MRKPDPTCCLCGLPYERIGNNPAPLYMGEGRCCDACNEVVIEARLDPGAILREIERVANAMARVAIDGGPHQMARTAICASRGPGLWAAHKAVLMQLREAHAPGDGSEPPTQAQ